MQVDHFIVTLAAVMLGGIAAGCLQVIEVIVADIPGNVISGEHGRIKAVDDCVALLDRIDQESSRSWKTSQSAPISLQTSSSVRPWAISSSLFGMSMPYTLGCRTGGAAEAK